MGHFPASAFDVLLIDPPWQYHGQQDKWGAAAKFYNTMTDSDIKALPITDWLTPRGVAFIWATGPRLDLAMECVNAWRLTYRGMAFVWIKTRKDGQPIGAQGVRPSIVKPTTEFVLAASRVAKGRPMPIADESIRQIVMAPKRAHSAKPAIVHERIEALYPNQTKAELFARNHRDGWQCFGNEL